MAWWPVVFWILLIPLIIAEIIIFVKTRRIFWLIYALAIFAYVVAVSYTLDVFDAGRNSIIITLLASAVLMALIGRQMGRAVKPRKTISRGALNAAIAIAAFIIVAFVVSVVFGKAAESVTPVQSVDADRIVVDVDPEARRIVPQQSGIPILTRTLDNDFFLPVPIVTITYRACLVTDGGILDLWPSEEFREYEEVPPFGQREIRVHVQPFMTADAEQYEPSELRVYLAPENARPDFSWVACDTLTMEPDYRIPVR